MIIETEVDGKPATVVFMDQDFVPCDKDVAAIAKVIFEDGSSKFINPDGVQVQANGKLS